ncbi:MAG: hypothetical protein AAF738_00990 [Bacteroidota bacterium]
MKNILSTNDTLRFLLTDVESYKNAEDFDIEKVSNFLRMLDDSGMSEEDANEVISLFCSKGWVFDLDDEVRKFIANATKTIDKTTFH